VLTVKGGGSNTQRFSCEKSVLTTRKNSSLEKQENLLKSFVFGFGFGFGFGMLRLTVSLLVWVQIEPKFPYFGFSLNSGFGQSLKVTKFGNP
jgi:hypothetical protein